MAHWMILFLLKVFVIGTLCCDDDMTLLCSRLISMATKGTSPVIVYDESFGYTAQTVNLLMQNNQLMTMCDYRAFHTFLKQHMMNLLEDQSLPDIQKQLNILVICRKGCIKKTFSHATHLDNTLGQRSLLRHFSSWLMISPDSPAQLNITLDHVAWMRVTKVAPLSGKIMPYRLRDIFQNITETNMGSFSFSTTEVYTLLWMPHGRKWSHVNLYYLTDDQLYKSIFPNKLMGLNGRQLVIATLEWLHYAVRKVIDGKVKYVGSGFDVVEALRRKFNFSYVTVEPEDMEWGQEQENGSWTGVTGMVQRAEADFCPVPYGMNFGRKKALDFTHIVHSSAFSALYKIQRDNTNDWLYFLSCYSWLVFLCGFVSLLWIGLLAVSIYCQKARYTNWTGGLAICLEIVLNIPLRQDINLPNVTSSRILVCTWCLFCMVMTAVYTGNLVAFSTVEKRERPFKTVQQLAKQDQFAIGMLEGAYAENVLKNSDDATLKKLYRKLVKPISSAGTDKMISDAVHGILEEKLVLLASGPVKEAIMSVTCKDVVEMEEKLFPLHSVYIFPRKSSLMKLFDSSIMRLWDLGVMGKLETDQTPKTRNCTSPVQGPRFRLAQLKTVLLACSVGILVAALVLLVEILKKRTSLHA